MDTFDRNCNDSLACNTILYEGVDGFDFAVLDLAFVRISHEMMSIVQDTILLDSYTNL